VDNKLECQEITVIKHTVEMQTGQLTSQAEVAEHYILTMVLVTAVDQALAD
jgi:hypothetical protein